MSTLKPEVIITKWWADCPGYLDTVLSIFDRHDHPFVLVSTLAMRWNGGNNLPQKEIDVLVRSADLKVLVDELVESGEWELSKNYASEEEMQTMINYTSIRDVWLKACISDPAFDYLRFWPEELYHLKVDCNKVEIPDISTRNHVVLEEEYYRDPYRRFGPPLLRYYEESNTPLLSPIQERARMKQNIPIFIPKIEDHLNALLDQNREQIRTRRNNGGAPNVQIHNFIRYLYLDWTPAREWPLRVKIRERNQELMVDKLNRYRRKPLLKLDRTRSRIINYMPWDSPIRPEFQQFAG